MGYKKKSFQAAKLGLIACLLTQFSASVFAGEKENKIIDRAIEAYGGEKLLNLKSLKYTDKINHFIETQSGHNLQGPMTMHFNKVEIDVYLDFINKQSELKRKTTRLVGNHESKNITNTHRMFFGDKGYVIDHCFKSYRASNHINFANADMGYSRMVDTIVVKQLLEDKENGQWVDIAYIKGQPHDVVTFNAAKRNEYSVYLNQKTGVLSRMLQKRGNKTRHYDFFEHQTTQGVTWAKSMFVSTDNQPIYQTDERKLQLNLNGDKSIQIPHGYKPQLPRKMVDESKLTIRELAEDVYFVGQGWGYTLFIDMGNYYMSAGSWGYENNTDSWKKALDLLRKTTGSDKLVSQHLVSHHHTDHMSALNSIVAEGVNLILHPSDISAVNKHLAQPLDNSRFIPISEATKLAAGKVMLFDVPNSHASHNMVMYLPESKILFTEDMFGSSFEVGHHSPANWPHLDTYQRLDKLMKKLEELGLEVEHYVSSHHVKVLSQGDIDEAMKLACSGE